MSDDGSPFLYFRYFDSATDETPTIQSLKYSFNGWLLEAVHIYRLGEIQFECSVSRNYPLSVSPENPHEIEDEWETGYMKPIDELEFLTMSALAKRIATK